MEGCIALFFFAVSLALLALPVISLILNAKLRGRVNALEAQLADRDVTIELSEPAKAWLIEHGYDEQMGARPMARVIQEHIKRHLAEELLFGRLVKGGVVQVGLKDRQLTFDYAEAGQEAPPPGKKRKSRQPADAP